MTTKGISRAGLIPLWALIAGLCLQGTALGAEVEFGVVASHLGLKDKKLAEGHTEQDIVSVVLPAEIYDPPSVHDPAPREAASRATPVEAAIGDFSAWKANDADWIVSNFVSGEQEEVRDFLDDEEMRAANRVIQERHEKLYIWADVRHGGFALVLVSYDDSRQFGVAAAFIETGEGWQRTNSLSEDPVFDLVWAAFRQGTMTTQ